MSIITIIFNHPSWPHAQVNINQVETTVWFSMWILKNSKNNWLGINCVSCCLHKACICVSYCLCRLVMLDAMKQSCMSLV
jgi:hypothetical protein